MSWPPLLPLVAACVLVACAGAAPSAAPSAGRGRALLLATADSLPDHVGNALRCASCHLDAGTRPGPLTFVGVRYRYPAWNDRAGREVTLADRIDECFRRSLLGAPLPPGSRAQRDLLAWMDSLSPASLPDSLRRPAPVALADDRAGDATRGAMLYAGRCAACHGPDGRGDPGPAHAGAPPPLWGPRSFAIAAGLARRTKFAGFILRYMPPDSTPRLSADDARDIAAYVLGQPRPRVADQELDFPLGRIPPDLPYPVRSAPAR